MSINNKVYFPVHLDGGNRGCEGIAKGTALIIGKSAEDLIGLCTNSSLDHKLSIDKYVSLINSRKPSFIDKIGFHLLPYFWSKEKMINYEYRYWYNGFLSQITPNDIMLSTGGDMLCYNDNMVIYTNNYLHNKGLKTVLWGCSMGRENLTPQKEQTLRNFSLIVSRDSLTCEFFKELGLQNVFCFPDPAFVLQPEDTHLPNIFSMGDVIGLNVSNYVLGEYSLDTSFGKEVKEMIEYVLNETSLNILLIPHVTWNGQDDRIVSNIIKNHYSTSERVSVLDIDELNYCQIRYVISKCRYFIGARTHAVISAYSTCVPALALGYSIKSRGIAKDIGLSNNLVVNSKERIQHNRLLESFIYMCDHEHEIKKHLHITIPEYIKKPYNATSVLNTLF